MCDTAAVEVRLCVLRCFKNADQSFLSHLAQADMLELIFMSLHDEKLEIQEEAVALLGKLGDLNPAFVLPRMRKVLLETLSQLTNSRVGRFVSLFPFCWLFSFVFSISRLISDGSIPRSTMCPCYTSPDKCFCFSAEKCRRMIM